MPLVEWFRLWLFPPARPVDARATHAPKMEGGTMTPIVTQAEIPPERRALLLGVQQRQHEIIGRLTAARARRQMEAIDRQERRAEA